MSKIEWTERTWNPIAGCSKVSAGCTHCYAETMAARLEAMGQAKYAGLTVLEGSHRVWTGKVAFDEKALLEPLRRKKPTTYFVNSMSDLFHEGVTDEQIDRIFAVMALCPQHTFQVLTKRPERMKAYLDACVGRLADRIESMRTDEPRRAVGPLPHLNGGERWFPLANVWLGVSVENQATADERIPLLLQTPAAVRFISAEPLLGPVNISNFVGDLIPVFEPGRSPLEGCGLPTLSGYLRGLDWAIVGGESGPGARPMHPDWARSLRDQCAAAGVAFFFKQWGEWAPMSVAEAMDRGLFHSGWMSPEGNGAALPSPGNGFCYGAGELRKRGCAEIARMGKKAAGALFDGREWRQMPGEAR